MVSNYTTHSIMHYHPEFSPPPKKNTDVATPNFAARNSPAINMPHWAAHRLYLRPVQYALHYFRTEVEEFKRHTRVSEHRKPI